MKGCILHPINYRIRDHFYRRSDEDENSDLYDSYNERIWKNKPLDPWKLIPGTTLGYLDFTANPKMIMVF